MNERFDLVNGAMAGYLIDFGAEGVDEEGHELRLVVVMV